MRELARVEALVDAHCPVLAVQQRRAGEKRVA